MPGYEVGVTLPLHLFARLDQLKLSRVEQHALLRLWSMSHASQCDVLCRRLYSASRVLGVGIHMVKPVLKALREAGFILYTGHFVMVLGVWKYNENHDWIQPAECCMRYIKKAGIDYVLPPQASGVARKPKTEERELINENIRERTDLEKRMERVDFAETFMPVEKAESIITATEEDFDRIYNQPEYVLIQQWETILGQVGLPAAAIPAVSQSDRHASGMERLAETARLTFDRCGGYDAVVAKLKQAAEIEKNGGERIFTLQNGLLKIFREGGNVPRGVPANHPALLGFNAMAERDSK